MGCHGEHIHPGGINIDELLAQIAKEQDLPADLLIQILRLEQELLDLDAKQTEAVSRIQELLTKRSVE